MTQRGITYVTKMKTRLNYEVLKDESIQTPEGLMQVRIQDVVLTKQVKAGEPIEHRARIVTYPDVNKKKLISLLTNDFELELLDIIEVYRKRRAIELLFKQIKQNFPLRDYCIIRHSLRYFRHLGLVIYKSKLPAPSVWVPSKAG